MFRNIALFTICWSCVFFLYGLLSLYVDVEENACRMTYMFGQPQFARVNMTKVEKFPNYGLYYYYEGPFSLNVNEIHLNGAPVIFIPGNAGSMKQVRSLASVALRKSYESVIKLNYFTVDFNEELSGLYGEYLNRQQEFLELCILKVVSLYKHRSVKTKVVLIGHSMGGLLSKSALMTEKIAKTINSIIFISSPSDKPVINLDYGLNQFYKRTNDKLSWRRRYFTATNTTNVCCKSAPKNDTEQVKLRAKYSKTLENLLLISIGGGSRDLMVREELTSTKFADIHTMTYSIPHVWLSCDHLASVWCLQLMQVINRYLFAISEIKKDNFIGFIDDKKKRLKAAKYYFRGNTPNKYDSYKHLTLTRADLSKTWVENIPRVSSKRYPNGIKEPIFEYFDLKRFAKYERLYLELVSYDEKDWLFGCLSNVSIKEEPCDKTVNLARHISLLPAGEKIRSKAELNLVELKQRFGNLTYIIIQMPLVNKMIQLNVDFYNPSERHWNITSVSFLNFREFTLKNETMQGTLHYKVNITGLQGTFQSLWFKVKPVACYDDNFAITMKVCIPWAPGFERHQVLSNKEGATNMFVHSPVPIPPVYNTSMNPITVDIYLDPACRCSISYQLSVANSMARMIKEFFYWFPSHLVAVLIIVLRNQTGYFVKKNSLKSLRPFTGFFQYSSLLIITGCRVVKKLMINPMFAPLAPDASSYYALVVIHSLAIATSIVAAIGLWGMMLFNTNLFVKVFQRFVKFSFSPPAMMANVMSFLPLSVGVLGVAIAIGTSSGLGLIFASGFYFMMISGAFKDFLEDQIWSQATSYLRSKFAKNKKDSDEKSPSSTSLLGSSEASTSAAAAAAAAAASTSASALHSRPKKEEVYEGLEQFSYHFVLFLLLLIMTALNIPSSIAWIKEKRRFVDMSDPTLISTVVTLSSLALLLQMGAPRKIPGSSFIKVIFYGLACLSVLIAQDQVFCINFIIAAVFSSLTIYEIYGWSLRIG